MAHNQWQNSMVQGSLVEKIFQRPKKKMCGTQPNDQTGSPIFNLCRKVREQFASHLTWVPGNGKQIKIWDDSILGDPPLEVEPESSAFENLDG
jgi:hypothetical protein